MNKYYLKQLYFPSKKSHKGQNGRLLIIGGSKLFHSASLWALKVASRIVDLVHYASVEENNKIVHELKKEFRDGIVVPRVEIEDYIKEDDCILIGPGMVRSEASISNTKYQISNIKDVGKYKNEGIQTYSLTKYLLQKYPHKKWVIDAGALQMMEPEWIPEKSILTPHRREFEYLLKKTDNKKLITNKNIKDIVCWFAQEYQCTILLKGEEDIVASEGKVEIVKGGNAGMTKGGTGDVLAGLVAGLYCKNDAFAAATAASIINKKAGEDLAKEVSFWFNASDLADQIPKTMKELLIKSN